MTNKPIDSPYIAWFDLETTGNRLDDQIIEVGFVLTDRELAEQYAESWVVKPLAWNIYLPRMTGVVRDMHTANGLLRDVEESDYFASDVDHEVSHVLRFFGNGRHIPFAGSGVSHFDRKYIRREMPRTDALLSYWSLDIGVMRRWLQWWGIETPGSELRQAKTHRALDDIREHIAEAKVIRDTLRLNAERAWMYEGLG